MEALFNVGFCCELLKLFGPDHKYEAFETLLAFNCNDWPSHIGLFEETIAVGL